MNKRIESLCESSESSIHKQVLPPAVVGDADVSLDEMNMARAGRAFQQSHAGLLGGPVPFAIVAFHAGADEVFPRVGPFVHFGDDMVDGHGAFGDTAVLAAVAIAKKDILPCQHDPFIGDFFVRPEADDRRERPGGIDGP